MRVYGYHSRVYGQHSRVSGDRGYPASRVSVYGERSGLYLGPLGLNFTSPDIHFRPLAIHLDFHGSVLAHRGASMMRNLWNSHMLKGVPRKNKKKKQIKKYNTCFFRPMVFGGRLPSSCIPSVRGYPARLGEKRGYPAGFEGIRLSSSVYGSEGMHFHLVVQFSP